MKFTPRCIPCDRCGRHIQRTAFTLIEVLVVIATIGLLASMLVPNLRSARERAKTVVCSANISAIGRAAHAYASDHAGWLAGSPGTSGSVMYGRGPEPEPMDEDFPTDPMQIWDYAGALAPKYMGMSLPANRAERMAQLVVGVFACPSNDHLAKPVSGAEEMPVPNGPIGGFDEQRMVSYNTIRNFMMWPRTMVDRDPSQPWGPRAPFIEAGFDTIGGNALHPKRYRPHLDRLTNPAGKVYFADGNRFTDESGTITYDVDWNAEAGGAFCNGGPTLREWSPFNGRFLLSSYHYDKSRGKIGYRHSGSGGDRGIVVNYFDGHSELISEKQSREPDLWWPKGTWIPFEEFNDQSVAHLVGRLGSDFDYTVGR